MKVPTVSMLSEKKQPVSVQQEIQSEEEEDLQEEEEEEEEEQEEKEKKEPANQGEQTVHTGSLNDTKQWIARLRSEENSVSEKIQAEEQANKNETSLQPSDNTKLLIE